MSQRHIAPAYRRGLFEELEQNVEQQKCSEFDFVQVCHKFWPLKFKAKGSVNNIPPACRSIISHQHIVLAYRRGLFKELEQNVQQQKCSEFDFVQGCYKVWPLKFKAKGSVNYIPPACRSVTSHRLIAEAYLKS